MSADQVISASAWYDMMLGVANKREYKTKKAAEMINRYAKTANRNMRELEKAGYDFYAYDPAKSSLEAMYGKDTNKRFKTNWTPQSIEANFDEFMESARALRRFIRSDAHTVATISKKSKDRADFLITNFISKENKLYGRLMNPQTEEERKIRREFERMVSGGTLSQLISEGYGNTGETIEAAIYALEHGEHASEIEERLVFATEKLTAYKEGTLDIEDLARLVRGR